MKISLAKFLLLFVCAILLSGGAFAQAKMPEDKSKRPSPPATVSTTVGAAKITVDYSRPSMKGRKIFGALEPYGKVWRTGANEATTFEASQAVTINGQALPAGKYALFTIPGEQEWTIIFNKTAEQWGAYKYDEKQDALRVKVKPTKPAQPVEQFTIKADKAGTIMMTWENSQVAFKVGSGAKAQL
ncbi:conserved hypothetical protein [Hymenobacter roseosalivarius DSM 11622]|uniref:DUF2911 domain-containing protein n=1 Tax=Hymenobacter roseosalivarius DSM 11622 TaxID=645990 RepID=A0A1W1W0S7_9BACT|nr:DUF2911 domain-containing protein [Hymenobacter roseosalivarius]SMB99215.1 conserved hypothetical protein [Hymenobacter roseosalivarius DSM 11622]